MLILPIVLFLAIILPNNIIVSSWKPITKPLASYTIRQSHPGLGSSSSQLHSINSIVVPSQIAKSSIENSHLSYLSDDADDDDVESQSLISASDGYDDEYKGFQSEEGRFLTTGTGYEEDTCSVDKYAFDGEGSVHYRNKLTKLNQFTICYWMRFTNHSGDHTLLTYSVDDEPREIQMWIANSKGSSYISMAIHGQQIYRLNYPLKMRKWHHSCSSWNGKTGEWQLWVKAERVGRGFHNRLVGHESSSKGILFSGGPSITGKTTNGLHFEMTLLQIYKVALTAGKAHRDHKHHHVHHFDHNGPATSTTPAPRPIQPIPGPMNPRLANGQIPTQVRINLAGQQMAQQQQQQQQQQQSIQGVPSQILGGSFGNQQAIINTNFINGQFHTGQRLIAQQLASNGPLGFPQQQQQTQPPQQQLQLQSQGNQLGVQPITFPSGATSSQFFSSPASVQFIDSPSGNQQRFLFKRKSNDESVTSASPTKIKQKNITKRETAKLSKRGLVMLGDGSLVDDSLLAHGYQFEGLAKYGLPAFKQGLETKMNIEDEIKEHDREPAEEEVKAVMNVCTSCDSEPFKGAIVLTWKDVRVSQSGTLKGRSVGGCGYF